MGIKKRHQKEAQGSKEENIKGKTNPLKKSVRKTIQTTTV